MPTVIVSRDNLFKAMGKSFSKLIINTYLTYLSNSLLQN